jgi:hypothetical protein
LPICKKVEKSLKNFKNWQEILCFCTKIFYFCVALKRSTGAGLRVLWQKTQKYFYIAL